MSTCIFHPVYSSHCWETAYYTAAIVAAFPRSLGPEFCLATPTYILNRAQRQPLHKKADGDLILGSRRDGNAPAFLSSPRLSECGHVGLAGSTAHLQVRSDGGVQLADGGFISVRSQGHHQVQDRQSAQRQETKEGLSGA